MRLPEDCWVRALGYNASKELARAAPSATALNTAVSRAVSLALGARPGSTTYDLRLHELRSLGCERVARTEEQCYFVTRAGELLEFLDDTNETAVPRTLATGGARVVSVSAGHDYVVALTEHGQLWSYGEGSQGQLGHGDHLRKTEPTLIEALADRRAVNVSCGYDHAWAVTQSGDVYHWGCVDHVLDEYDNGTALSPYKLDTNGVSMVSVCGGYNAVILVSNGRIYGSGKNDHGELGVGDTLPRYRRNGALRQLGGDVLSGEFVVKVSTVCRTDDSYIHTLVLTSSGRVFGFGSNHFGQLATDEFYDITSPRLIDQFTNATDICAMDCGSFVVTGGKRLFAFGTASPLFVDDLHDMPAPTPVLLGDMSLDSGRLLSLCADARRVREDASYSSRVLLLADPDNGAGEQLFLWQNRETSCRRRPATAA